MNGNFIARSKNIKLYAYGSLAFGLAAGIGGFVESGIFSLILWFGFLFFGFIALMILLNMYNHSFALKIDDDGVTDQTPLLGVGLIKWGDIRDVGVDEIHGQRNLLLKVDDTQIYLNRLTMLQRFIPSVRKMGTRHYENGYLPIHFGSLDADEKTIFELIASEWEKHRNVVPQKKETITPDEYHTNDESIFSHAQETVNQPSDAQEIRVDGSAMHTDTGGLNISDLNALEKLAELRDKNIITEEEFMDKKNQILGL